MEKRTIGIKANYYPEKRNFLGLPIVKYRFKKELDIYRIIAYVYFKVRKKTHPKWLNLFYDFNIGKYDCLHFFNAVSLGSKPWITTYEYFLPRGAHQIGVHTSEEKYILRTLNALASKSCKKIIALSNHAKQSQIEYLQNFDKEKGECIIEKIVVMHTPQQQLIKSINEKKVQDGLNLILIGSDFFRKGGLEVLRVVDKFLDKKFMIKLVIISDLKYGDYASTSTVENLNEAKTIINKHANILHYNSKPNTEVLDLLKVADLALLPSYDETYGYSVLEAQACGCPVVTTNGGAFSEINNNRCGWVIEVPLKGNRSIPYSETEKSKFINIVEENLEIIIRDLVADKSILLEKGKRCLDRIANEHDVQTAAINLELIYDRAIGEG